MARLRLTALAAGAMLALCLSTSDARAAAFNIYYRPGAGEPWTYYIGKATQAAADATANDLRKLGFQAEVQSGGPPATKRARPASRSSSVAVQGVTVAPGYLGGFRSVYGPGHRFRSETVHHYHHAHATAKATAKASAKSGHAHKSSKHPSRGAHAAHRQHQRAKPPSHSHHHAQHHVHTHAHHHAH